MLEKARLLTPVRNCAKPVHSKGEDCEDDVECYYLLPGLLVAILCRPAVVCLGLQRPPSQVECLTSGRWMRRVETKYRGNTKISRRDGCLKPILNV